MAQNPPTVSRTEQRRQQADQRRNAVAAEVLGDAAGQAVTAARTPLSSIAQVMAQAFPRELVDRGLIAFNAQSQPRVAGYDPSLLAPNP